MKCINANRQISFLFFVLSVCFDVLFGIFCVYCKQGELEKLNQSTDDINRWESELEVRLQHQHHQAAAIATLKSSLLISNMTF